MTWLIITTINTIPLKHLRVQESGPIILAIEFLQCPCGLSIMTALASVCHWVFWLAYWTSKKNSFWNSFCNLPTNTISHCRWIRLSLVMTLRSNICHTHTQLKPPVQTTCKHTLYWCSPANLQTHQPTCKHTLWRACSWTHLWVWYIHK